ncbi:sulfotransferase family protein [Alkalispirochaeta alkalica]|uniref:sulfotransferase family protein n=1 Tax=Alkalispirochaeta alkalica TaxID=46356 RepID=UPI000A0025EE|nr:sulfotransferase family protein [Alkalispirochaeta alkalica]
MIPEIITRSEVLLNLRCPLSRGIVKPVNKRWVIHRAAVSKENSYCYFRIPKCANSTITKSLAHYDQTVDIGENDTERDIKKKFDNLSVITRRNRKNFFFFTFVRNPYERILSSYLDKIVWRPSGCTKYRKKISRRLPSHDSLPSFGHFIEYLEKGGLWDDPHWLPQYAMIPFDVSSLDFIGKVESLDRDLEYVIGKIFGSEAYSGPVTRASGRQNSGSLLKEYYDPELERRVHELYCKDFEIFGYHPV